LTISSLSWTGIAALLAGGIAAALGQPVHFAVGIIADSSLQPTNRGATAGEVPDFADLPRLSFPRNTRAVTVRTGAYPARLIRDPDQSAYTRKGQELIATSALTRDQVVDILERIRVRDRDGTYWTIDDSAQQVHLGHLGGVADGAWETGRAGSVTGTDNHRALQAFIHWRGHFQQADPRTRKPVLIPPGVWRVDGQLKVDRPDVSISGYGATLVGKGLMWFGSKPSTGLTIAGLKSVNNSGRGADKLWSLYGARSTFVDTEWVYDPGGDFQLGFAWPESKGSRFLRYKSSGGSEIVIYAPDTLFDGFDVTGVLGDDGFVIKAPGSQAYNIRIVNGTIRDSASILGIGSEIGSRGVDDPGFRSFVRDVRVANVRGENVAYGLYIKPGAVLNDYRNGLVENVDFQADIVDLTGAKFRAGARIDAARGAIVRDIGINLTIRARARDSRDRNAGLRITASDKFRGRGVGASPSRIERIKARMKVMDASQGRPNGPGTPGYPIDYAAHITAANGATVGRVDLWLEVDGTSRSAIVNGPDVAGPVVVHSLVARNLCNSPKTQRYDTVILAGSPVTISPGAYRVSRGRSSCTRSVSAPGGG